MRFLIATLDRWLSVFPESFQPYVFFGLALVIIVLLIRVLRGIILLAIAVVLVLLTLYFSSALFGIPFSL